MAQSKNSVVPDKGHMEGMTFYTRKGQTIIRSAHRTSSETERSPIVMNRRARWKNVQNSWSQYEGALRGLFELKKPSQSEYNVYMSENLPTATVYLDKQRARGGTCVADHFVVSSGSLAPSIAVTSTEEAHVSSLGMNGLVVDEQTSVLQFVYNLEGVPKIDGQGWLELRFIQARQQVAGQDLPYMDVRWWGLELRKNDRRPLMSVLGVNDPGMGLLTVDGRLAARREEGVLVAWVLRHVGRDGNYQVTTQRLVGDNPLLEKYSNGVARFEAVYSYGPVTQPNYFKHGVDLQPGEVMFAPSRRYTKEDMKKSVFQVDVEAQVMPRPECGEVVGTGRVAQGSTVELSAVAAMGWTFLCWSDGVLSPLRQVTPQENCSFTAIFKPTTR